MLIFDGEIIPHIVGPAHSFLLRCRYIVYLEKRYGQAGVSGDVLGVILPKTTMLVGIFGLVYKFVHNEVTIYVRESAHLTCNEFYIYHTSVVRYMYEVLLKSLI